MIIQLKSCVKVQGQIHGFTRYYTLTSSTMHRYHILRLGIITAQIVDIAGFVILVN